MTSPTENAHGLVARDLPTVFDGLSCGLCLFGPDSRLIHHNKAFAALFVSLGAVKSLRGMAFEQLAVTLLDNGEIAGETATRAPDAWLAKRLERHRAASGAPFDERLADGRWVEVRDTRLETGGTLTEWRDITRRKQVLFQLEDILASAADGLAVWDQAGRLTMCNSRFLDRFTVKSGPPRPGMTHRQLLEALARDGAVVLDEPAEEWIARRQAARRAPENQVTERFSDGRFVLMTERRTRGGGMATVMTDVTDLKQNEASLEANLADLEMARASLEDQASELADMAEQLHAAHETATTEQQRAEEATAIATHQEARLRAILQTMAEGVIAIDDTGSVQIFNPAAEAIFGWSADEIIGRDVGLLMPDEVAAYHHQHVAGYASGERASIEGRIRELEGKRRDGTRFPLEQTITTARGAGMPLYISTVRDITERKAMEAELRRLATTDPLTQALNRRSFFERVARDVARAERRDTPLTLAILDLDHFKQVNDTYGHDIGDQVLKLFADTAREMLRTTDTFARFGGEEFVAALPDTRPEAAVAVMDRLRGRVGDLAVDTDKGPLTFSASVGVAVYRPGRDATVEHTLTRADQALYEAKHAGRNCVKLES